ncbi:MAG: hypothetical protein Tsb0013_18950 [Phycisphaerales bacterium]
MIEQRTRPMTSAEAGVLEDVLRRRTLMTPSEYFILGGCATGAIGGAYAILAGIVLYAGGFMGMSSTVRTVIALSIVGVVLACVLVSIILSVISAIGRGRTFRERLARSREDGEVRETVWRERVWFGIQCEEDPPEESERLERMLLVSPDADAPWLLIWPEEAGVTDEVGPDGTIVTTLDNHAALSCEAPTHGVEPIDLFVLEDDSTLVEFVYDGHADGAVQVLDEHEVDEALREYVLSRLAAEPGRGSDPR